MINDFKPSNSFEIANSKEFFEKLLAEFDDFYKDHLNPRFAINAAINSWHLTDWTYQEFFLSDARFKDSKENGKTISGLTKYQDFLKETCPELEYMRTITNGSKHCKINQNNRTEISNGDYCSSDYNRHDYNVSVFVIINDQTNEEVDFEELLIKTIDFWRQFLTLKYQDSASN